MLERDRDDLECSRKRSWEMIKEMTKAGGAVAAVKEGSSWGLTMGEILCTSVL